MRQWTQCFICGLVSWFTAIVYSYIFQQKYFEKNPPPVSMNSCEVSATHRVFTLGLVSPVF